MLQRFYMNDKREYPKQILQVGSLSKVQNSVVYVDNQAIIDTGINERGLSL